MIKSLIITASMAGSMTVGATFAFDKVKMATNEVVGVYHVAQQIDPWTEKMGEYAQHQKALFEASGRLEGLAADITGIHKPENGDGPMQIAFDFDQVHERFLSQSNGVAR